MTIAEAISRGVCQGSVYAILAALEQAGYVIVPKEPTEDMVSEAMRKIDPLGRENYVTREDVRTAWTAMIRSDEV